MYKLFISKLTYMYYVSQLRKLNAGPDLFVDVALYALPSHNAFHIYLIPDVI